jgi:hypothetical protein
MARFLRKSVHWPRSKSAVFAKPDPDEGSVFDIIQDDERDQDGEWADAASIVDPDQPVVGLLNGN